MTKLSTRAIENIEMRMKGMDEGSLRYQILENVKNFKASWIGLGQALYSVWKDKLYKDWEFATFDNYVSKEIGIKKTTAMKLLKSYYFLEKEEPSYLNKEFVESRDASAVPTYEAVNLLRLAKNKKTLDNVDYFKLKKNVLDHGHDASSVKKDLTMLMREREELEPEEARRKKRLSVIKRLITALNTLKTDIEVSKLLPAATVKEIASLISKLESEIA